MALGLQIKCTNNACAVCGLHWEISGVKSRVTVLLESKVKVKEVFWGKVRLWMGAKSRVKAEIGRSKILTPVAGGSTDCMPLYNLIDSTTHVWQKIK